MTVTVNGTEVWLDPAELPEFTYSLYSLSEPDKVNGTRSTTFKLPATNAVRTALGGWGPNEVPPYSGRPVIRISDGGAIIFEGECVVASRSEDEYELVVLGGNSGWVDAAKKTQLNELDPGSTPEVDRAYVVSQWRDEDAADCYPLVDFGSFADRTSLYDVPFEKLRPAVRVHRILSKFFNDNGFTVEAKGAFSALWKKLAVLPGTGRIQADESYLIGNTAQAAQVGTIAYTPTFAIAPDAIELTAIQSDPGGNFTGSPVSYASPFDMQLEATVNIELIATWAIAGTYTLLIGPYNYTTNNWVGIPRYFSTTTTTLQVDASFTVGPGTVAAGDDVRIGIGRSSTATVSCNVTRCNATFTPTNIEYQEGIAVELGTLLPKMKVSDLLKAVVNTQNLVVFTDYGEHRVELWRMDDWLKGISQGVDWSDRMDHTEPPKRLQADIPSRVEFRFMEDDQDVKAQEFREQNTLGIGDADRDVAGGWAQPYEVEVKFAGTVVAEAFGGLAIPTIWNDRAAYQVDEYEHEPRLVITDKTEPGSWTFEGVQEDQYPIAYMAGAAGTIAFGPVNGIVGSADTWWYNRLRRMGEGVTLEGGIRVWRHEQGEQNLSKPVWIHWGYGGGWFYVVKLSGVRPYGDDVALAELMPV